MSKFHAVCHGGDRDGGYPGWAGVFETPEAAIAHLEHFRCDEECHQDELPDLMVIEVTDEQVAVRSWYVGLSLTLGTPEQIPAEEQEDYMDMVLGKSLDDEEDQV